MLQAQQIVVVSAGWYMPADASFRRFLSTEIELYPGSPVVFFEKKSSFHFF
jgi:hypothetical protein